MNDESNISLVALLVAAFALFATAAQLLQSVFGTVEGYRKCQVGVMGPWAKMTRRTWVWTELRFQTRFTTPNIRLAHVPKDPDNGCFDCDSTTGGSSSSFILLPGTKSQRSYLTGGFLGFSKRRVHKRFYPRELALTTSNKSAIANADDDIDYTPDMVTWLSFVRSAYQYEEGAVRRPRENGSPSPHVGQYWSLYNWQPPELARKESTLFYLKPNTRETTEWPSASSHRSCVVVSFVERAWDLLPPDVVRPYAQSTLGTIIVMAHRMGMKWKDPLPNNSFLSAEGNGQSLTSTSIRGLGILFEFRKDFNADSYGSSGSQPFEKPLIPCEEADRLSCGLIPSLGLGILGKKGDESRLRSALQSWGLEKPVIESLIDDDIAYEASTLGAMLNSYIALSTSFLPVPGSPANRVIWPYHANGLFSVLRSWEGREVLAHRIKEELSQTDSNILYTILHGLETFKERYPDDYFCRWTDAQGRRNNKAVAMSSPSNPAKLTFVQFFRSQNTWIRSTFGSAFGEGQCKVYHALKKNYLASVPDVLQESRYLLSREGKKDGKEARANPWITATGPSTQGLALEAMHQYVDRLRSSVVQSMRQEMPEMFEEDTSVVEAWYLMMYRGICWFAPLDVDMAAAPTVASLHQYYGSDMPVYIG